jgi:hypothetical protein
MQCGIIFWGNLQGQARSLLKKDNACGIEGGTVMPSLKNNVNMKTLITGLQKTNNSTTNKFFNGIRNQYQ